MYTLKSIRAKNTDRGDGRYAEALISINNDQVPDDVLTVEEAANVLTTLLGGEMPC